MHNNGVGFTNKLPRQEIFNGTPFDESKCASIAVELNPNPFSECG
jgi:hypothetical protein